MTTPTEHQSPLPEAAGRRRRTVVVGAVAGLAVVVAVVAAVLVTGDRRAPDPGERGADSAAAAEAEAVRRGVDTIEEPSYAPTRPGYPDRLVVPELGVDAPVLPIRAPDRTLTPPADPQVLGWWVDGAKPGAPTGSALVVGHTVHTGGGALDDLETLEEGDEVLVRSRRTDTEYVVESVRVYRKGTLAARAADLFSQEVDGRLVLLTCEDWDGTRYLSNVVVTAVPATGSLDG